ncbi:hypothetical protein [Marinobacter pelagius]|uniref:Uncharacterized protein n=1 Tax=Marinobacter pelagius TaxID=379482 RepID=A0A1I4W112_9GAMM|nr:hypothetical protein [Marinobacter pelagius]SFN06849.1 hypothetical protein SAMN04487961_2020 [Marinobacter pelagius]
MTGKAGMMYRVFFLFIPMVAVLPGCASYYSHFAMFPAETSQGESRQVRVSWESAEYPDWWILDDRSTALKVETQCSARIWRLRDDSHDDAGKCGNGIRACAEAGVDRVVVRREDLDPSACIVVNPGQGNAQIADIEGRLELLVACEPVAPESEREGETENMDYLRASPVPYTVYTRKIPRGSLRASLPAFDESACE